MINTLSLKTILIISVVAVLILYVITLLIKVKYKKRYLFSGKKYQQHSIMNKTETILFKRLIKLFPDLHIFPQIPFSCIVTPKNKNDKKYFQQLWKINQKRVDFLLCNKSFKNICVIELDGSSHNNKRDTDKKRDKFFKECGLKTVRFSVSELKYLTNKELIKRII